MTIFIDYKKIIHREFFPQNETMDRMKVFEVVPACFSRCQLFFVQIETKFLGELQMVSEEVILGELSVL